MAKTKTVYVCSNCGADSPKWLGKCPNCGEWNTYVEEVVAKETPAAKRPVPSGLSERGQARPVLLRDITAEKEDRLDMKDQELNRVLGGGLVKGSLVLIGGEPGIGKSTLVLQTILKLHDLKVLYVSGEESEAQIKERAERLHLSSHGIEVLCTMRLEDILDALDSLNPVFTIIDSIQTVYSAEAGIVPGTVNQLKYCANELVSWVKERDSVLVMTAHVTKDGAIAGPKTLEHLVDTVISFERNNDDVRFLHAQKNRFGSVDELYSDKIDSARVSRIAAILEKRAGIRFLGEDIYINVAGGIRLSESAVDAALAAAMYSARTDVPVPVGTALFGELSLAGEIRTVPKIKQRAKTAEGLGFTNILAPENGAGITCVKDIRSLIKTVFAK